MSNLEANSMRTSIEIVIMSHVVCDVPLPIGFFMRSGDAR